MRPRTSLLALGLVFACARTTAAAGAAEQLTISRFGAVADDGKDDTAAFNSALAKLVGSPGASLELQPGTYDLATRATPPDGTSPPLLVVKDARDATIDGHGAQLVCHDFATLFSFENAHGLTIRNLSIDYDPLPFTAGQMVAQGDGYVDLRIEPHHPLNVGLRAESLLPYDPDRHRMGMRKDDFVFQPDMQRRTSEVGDRLLRVPVRKEIAFKPGDWAIVRHQIYSKNALDFRDCHVVTLENVTVYTCPGMALHANGGADFALTKFNVTVKPGSGRWFTATADATHFNGVRGRVSLGDCLLESMGDDGANIHNWYHVVTSVGADGKSFTCILGKDPTWEPQLPWPGDTLEIGRGENPLLPTITATVASAKLDPNGRAMTITLTAPPGSRAAGGGQPIEQGDVVGNASALPTAELRDCTIRRNRARGVLVQTRHATVEGCTFEDCSGAAVQVTSDARRWWEGMPADDVTIRGNTVRRVNFGIGSRQSAIDIFAEIGKQPAPQPVHRNITIEGNTIADLSGAGVHVGSAREVTIRGNAFTGLAAPAVTIDHSRDVTITGNSLQGPPQPGVHIGEGVDADTIHLSDNRGFAATPATRSYPQLGR